MAGRALTSRHGATRPRTGTLMTRSDQEGKSRAETRARLARLAWLLDSAVRIPGTDIRLGLDAALGLVPGLGDLVATGLSVYLIAEARRLGIPRSALLRMLANTGLDFLIGVVPVAGDIVDVFWRANRRNLAILDRHLEKMAERRR